MNGLLERLHGTLEPRMVATLATETEGKNRRDRKVAMTDWEDSLPDVLKGIRFSTQQATKYSPYFLLFGTEPRISLDLLTYDPKSMQDPNVTPLGLLAEVATAVAAGGSPSIDSACLIDRANALNEAAVKADKNILLSQEVMVKRHDKKRHAEENIPAQVGDQVYIVLSKKAKGKLAPKLDGPFVLVAYNAGKTLCNVKDASGRVWTERVEDIRYKP